MAPVLLSLLALAGLTLAVPNPGQIVIQQSEPFSGFSSIQSHPPPPPPGHPPIEIDFSHLTVWEILNSTLSRGPDDPDHPPEHPIPGPGPPHDPKPEHLPLRRLAHFVNKSQEIIDILDGKDQITFLAPDDEGLTPPDHRGGEHRHPGFGFNRLERFGGGGGEEPMPPFRGGRVHRRVEEGLADAYDGHSVWSSFDEPAAQALLEGGGEGDDDERRQRLLKLLAFILKYHVSSDVLTPELLFNSSTISTYLELARVRLNVHPGWQWKPIPGPTLDVTFNFYANKRGPTIKAKNGVIHLLNHPILPPLPPFELVTALPGWFSTFSSGAQLTKLDANLTHSEKSFAPEQHEELLAQARAASVPAELAQLFGAGEDDVNPAVMEALSEVIAEQYGAVEEHGHGKRQPFTVFVPSNRAFRKLGLKINAFLFSPWGKRILKYVLAYHVVPDVVVFSDYVYNHTDSKKFTVDDEIDVELPDEPDFGPKMCGRPGRPGFIEINGMPPHPPHRRHGFLHTVVGALLRVRDMAFGRRPLISPVRRFSGPVPPRFMPDLDGADVDESMTWPPWHHGPPPHGRRGNITHLVLPTLLEATLAVDVISEEVSPPPHVPGHVGIKRSVVVKPHAIKDPHSWVPGHEGGADGRPKLIFDPRVPVVVPNAPAWHGAVHVVPVVLLPPKPERKEPGGGDGDGGDGDKDLESLVLEVMQELGKFEQVVAEEFDEAFW